MDPKAAAHLAAFPTGNADEQTPGDGMTLRDYLAAKAMQGICAHPETWGQSKFDGLAGRAYGIADAMLRARQA